MIEVRTSGSTGAPKLIRLADEFVDASARRTIRFFGLDAGSRLHLCLSTEHIAGIMMERRARLCGAHLTREPATSTPLSAFSADSPEITLLAVVGTQLPFLIKKLEEGTLPRIRHLLVGGSALTGEWRRMAPRLAEHAWESYGMTETASHIALRPIVPGEEEPAPFRVLEGISVSTGADGCLAIDMAGLPAPLRTNDIAEMVAPGEFRILGRADNAIITGGKKVHPEHVEAVLARAGALRAGTYAIASRLHPKWGREVVIAATGIVDLQALKEKAGESLAPWEFPKETAVIPRIPMTPTGKIARAELGKLVESVSAACASER